MGVSCIRCRSLADNSFRRMTHSESPMRQFPTPWHVEKIPGGYTVRDAKDRVLARVYGQCEPIDDGVPALTLEEAEEMALTIAMLPQTLSESEKLHLRMAGQPCDGVPPPPQSALQKLRAS
jgi:hypothetical protein